MDPSEKLERIVALIPRKQMAAVHFKNFALLMMKLFSFIMAAAYLIAAILVARVSLSSLAHRIDDPELTEWVANLPHRFHVYFDDFTNVVAFFFVLSFIAMLVQGLAFRSFNKSNALLRQIASIAKK